MCSSASKRLPLSARRTAAVAAPAERLVEHDELDALEPSEQRMLGLADDPGELRRGPCALDRTHDGHGVAGIADRREPDQAELVGRVIEGQRHAVAGRGGRDGAAMVTRSSCGGRFGAAERFALQPGKRRACRRSHGMPPPDLPAQKGRPCETLKAGSPLPGTASARAGAWRATNGAASTGTSATASESSRAAAARSSTRGVSVAGVPFGSPTAQMRHGRDGGPSALRRAACSRSRSAPTGARSRST